MKEFTWVSKLEINRVAKRLARLNLTFERRLIQTFSLNHHMRFDFDDLEVLEYENHINRT